MLVHSQKDLYIKGIHINLLYKNNLLRCRVYNYGNMNYHLYYSKDKVLVNNKSDIRPKEQMSMQKLSRHPILLSEKMVTPDLEEQIFYLNFHLVNDKGEDVFTHSEKQLFILETPICFGEKRLDN